MKTVGIITEFNPFHKGHEYIIKKAKEVTDADYCVIITSGNFVQRGAPSFIDKYTKTKIALNHGANLVIEMPVQFSTASAEHFATCGVSILNSLGIIDYLAFGVENENLEVIGNIANILNNEQDDFKKLIKQNLSNGESFALARANALKQVIKKDNIDFLNKPNNILALEYIKALKKINSKIKPIGIKRIVADYHEDFTDYNISHNSEFSSIDNARLYSASNLRKLKNKELEDILIDIDINYKKELYKSYPLRLKNSFSNIAGSKLLDATTKNNNVYFDVPDFLWDKICNNISNYTDFTSFIMSIKTKEISYTSISRGLMHIILNITKHDVEYLKNNSYGNYIRVLGFRKDSSCLLTEISNNTDLALITKVSDYKDVLPKQAIPFFEKNLYADGVYRLCLQEDLKQVLPTEFTRKFITV